MKRFPVVSNHSAVNCFKCERSLAVEAASESGYAKGSGEFYKPCPCGVKTWYDLRKEAA